MKAIVNYLIQNIDKINESIVARYKSQNSEDKPPIIEKVKLNKMIYERSALIDKINTLRRERNDKGGTKELKDQISLMERELKLIESNIVFVFAMAPNIVCEDVKRQNIVVSNVEGSFIDKQSNKHMHSDMIKMHSIVQIEGLDRRFNCLTHNIAHLSRMLKSLILDYRQESDYIYCEIPCIINSDTLTYAGQLPRLAKHIFHINGEEDYYLIPTGEVTLLSISNTIIERKETKNPIKLYTISSCFRNEYTHKSSENTGIIRQYEFTKIENVIQCMEEERDQMLKELVKNFTTIIDMLGFEYRTILVGSEDMSISAYKQYDVEVYLPVSKKYLELGSFSDCGIYQNIRKDGNTKRITLNGTQGAIGRLITAYLEYYQNENGDIVVAEVLKKYIRQDILSKIW